jgi:hypothetical protein
MCPAKCKEMGIMTLRTGLRRFLLSVDSRTDSKRQKSRLEVQHFLIPTASFFGWAVSMGTNSRHFHKVNEFPNEAFVQQAIETYFTEQGFQMENEGYSDLVCRDAKRGQKWIIEAKGQTSALGLYSALAAVATKSGTEPEQLLHGMIPRLQPLS